MTDPVSTDTPSGKAAAARALLILLAGAVVAGGLYLAKPEPERQVIEPPRIIVDAIEVVRETVQLKVATHGTVTASTETRLVAEVQGRVTEVSDKYVAGGFFNAGELLIQIDDLEYRTAVKRAEAEVAREQTRLAEERGRAEVAYQDWLSRNTRIKRSEEAKDLALRKPQIAEALASLEAAQAELERAKENLARTAVRAPYDGILKSRSVDLGQHLGTGQELGVFFATDRLEVRLPIPEHKLSALNLPSLSASTDESMVAQLSVTVNGETNFWQAKIERSESVLDERSRVMYLIASIDDPYQLRAANKVPGQPLRLGTFVNAEVYGKVVDNIVRIPHHVLRTDNQVWVIDAEGNMHERAVEILNTDKDYTYLSTGLGDGEFVAIGHLDDSVSGIRVEVANVTRLSPQDSLLPQRNLAPAGKMPPQQKPVSPSVAAKKPDENPSQGI